MLKLPAAPPALTTRQIECVSCREIFVISEDYFPANQAKSPPIHGPQFPFSSRSTIWRVANDLPFSTRARYEQNRAQLHEVTSPNAISNRANVIPDEEPYIERHLNCPRCGADNRNWVQIRLGHRPVFVTWIQRFPSATTAIIISIILSSIFLILAVLNEALTNRQIILTAVIIVLFPWVLTVAITNQWNNLREDANQRRFLPATARNNRALFQLIGSILLIWGFFVAFIPGSIHYGPRFFRQLDARLDAQDTPSTIERVDETTVILLADLSQQGVSRFDPTSDEDINGAMSRTPLHLTPIENAVNSLAAINLANQTFVCENIFLEATLLRLMAFRSPSINATRSALINGAILQLEALQAADGPGCRFDLITNAAVSLRRLHDNYEVVCGFDLIGKRCDIGYLEQSAQDLEALIQPPPILAPLTIQRTRIVLRQTRMLMNNPPIGIEEAVQVQLQRLEDFLITPTPLIDFLTRPFVRGWVGFVGLAGILATLFSAGAAFGFAGFVNAQVPRPFYASVARMSRIVAWEANLALEIGADVTLIEWTDVSRNEEGGLAMHGVLRDESPTQSLAQPVLAAQYSVSTDKWGRIIEATVRNGRTLPRPKTRFSAKLAGLHSSPMPTVPIENPQYIPIGQSATRNAYEGAR